ncbi:hypothetical protein X777_10402 [Ooceraea biroi]|uniref:Uncharacterized protein n=1 Tax=Ooceraea biroi TaxID=2015173 RepID=A0A026W7Y2_OOCBI|nr:hypothetical protein X777_10402 [Ooceraea biroi]
METTICRWQLNRVLQNGEIVSPEDPGSSEFARLRCGWRPAGWLAGCTLSHRCRWAGSAGLPGNQTARLPSADRSGCGGVRDHACQTARKKERERERPTVGHRRATEGRRWWGRARRALGEEGPPQAALESTQ